MKKFAGRRAAEDRFAATVFGDPAAVEEIRNEEGGDDLIRDEWTKARRAMLEHPGH